MVKRTPSTVLCQHESVGGCMGAFTGQDGGSETDSKAMGFNLDMTLHQDHLEGPALKPSKSEGIRQRCPYRQRAHPMAPTESCKGPCQQMRSDLID